MAPRVRLVVCTARRNASFLAATVKAPRSWVAFAREEPI